MTNGFLPVSRQDMIDREIDQFDFVYIIGDAYVDHPSFGHAVISRVLEAHGYRVGIISQPDWKDENSITILGKPRLAFLISGGNMDSMVNHYFVFNIWSKISGAAISIFWPLNLSKGLSSSGNSRRLAYKSWLFT